MLYTHQKAHYAPIKYIEYQSHSFHRVEIQQLPRGCEKLAAGSQVDLLGGEILKNWWD